MLCVFLFLLVLLPTSFQLFPGAVPDEGDYRHLYSTVCVSARVFEGYDHSLPYFLGLLEGMRYPKDRIHIFFYVKIDTKEAKSTLSDLEKYEKIVFY